MDIEKYTNGKVYKFFDASFKLVVWNLLTLFLTCAAVGIFYLGFYLLKEGTVAGLLMLTGVLFGIFIFIPAYTTIFSCVKIYIEEGKAETLWLYFDRFKDNFKTLYKIELIIFPIIMLFSFAIYFYFQANSDKNVEDTFITVIYQIGYTLLLFCNFSILLCFLNIPMVLSYFRMKTKTIMKFTLIMTFKHFIETIIYLLLFIGPVIICILVNVLIPVWFLIGLSLPQVAIYYISRKDYWRMVNNINVVRDEEVYIYEEEKNETGN